MKSNKKSSITTPSIYIYQCNFDSIRLLFNKTSQFHFSIPCFVMVSISNPNKMKFREKNQNDRSYKAGIPLQIQWGWGHHGPHLPELFFVLAISKNKKPKIEKTRSISQLRQANKAVFLSRSLDPNRKKRKDRNLFRFLSERCRSIHFFLDDFSLTVSSIAMAVDSSRSHVRFRL